MKSAYEIAMERMEAESGPTRKLDDKERAQLAQIESKCDAQVAELRIGYEQKLAVAPPTESGPLQEEMTKELARIEERRESEKDKIWNGPE